MIKTFRKIFAGIIVLSMCITAMPVQAFAAEDGLVSNVVTTTDTAADEEGNTVVTVTVETQTDGITTDGVTVSRTEIHSEAQKTDSDGNKLSTKYVDRGVENREWNNGVQPGEGMIEVKVELKPDEKVTGSATETVTGISGDEQQSPEDADYDYTTTITTIERSVTAESSELDITMAKVDTDLKSIAAEDYEGKDPNVFGPAFDFVAGTAETVPQPEEQGYDYQLVGYGDATNELKVLRDYITYKKVDGKPVTDENGNFIIESIQTKVDNTPMQIALRKGEDGEYEYFFGYCIDSDTEVNDGAWYKVSNLEDNDYYPDPESAARLRAVVNNGYWGTESGRGSIDQIKTLIKEACGPDAVITVDTDGKGGKTTYKIADIIDGLTEAEALAATQAAIWCFANGDEDTFDGKDGYIAHGPVNVYKPNPNRNSYLREYLPESDARAMAVFNWLRDLEPMPDTEEVSTVINEKNAIDSMALTVGDKAENHADNMDEDDDNDVYNIELSFTLAFVPDMEKDDLLVYLLDDEGNPINDKEGNPVVRRLAGSNSEGRTADAIQPDENGVYTLTDLQLSENSDFKFDLHLEGAQYLKENVYIYTAHGGSDKSQSIVGIAEGTHTVDVSVGMTLRFEGEESKHVAAERVWHTERISVPDPVRPDKPTVSPEDDDPIIVDAELAEPVKTGDVSFVLMGMAAVSAMGLAVICLSARKAKNN